jgi:hypothetical protein
MIILAFSKTNVTINLLNKLTVFLVKNANYSPTNFQRKYLINYNIGPSANLIFLTNHPTLAGLDLTTQKLHSLQTKTIQSDYPARVHTVFETGFGDYVHTYMKITA